MLKPLSANIGDLGDYINCKIGQTPQLFRPANRIFHCPGIRTRSLTHTVASASESEDTKER